MKNVLVTTQHRGVFFCQIDDEQLNYYKKKSIEDPKSQKHLVDLKNCRMAIYFGTTKGVMQLANEGPTQYSKIGSPADVHILHDVTSIFDVTDNAAEKWMSV